ncbi:MAG: alpha/beta hydrolase [Pseudomonadota bacterium]
MASLNFFRQGSGKPLLLVHGLGSNGRSWSPVLDRLAADRELIVVDLPGFGKSPPLEGRNTIPALADALSEFLSAEQLMGVDAAGHSMGGRLVLELARRGGLLGGVVALSPGGFWQGWERHYTYSTLWLSIRVLRRIQRALPTLSAHAIGRTLLFAQLSARPWKISPEVALNELKSCSASPVFDELLWELVYGEAQQGAALGSIPHPLVIAWGRQDRLTLPRQARRARSMFPDAHLHWFNACGHYPQFDQPIEAAHLILAGTKGLATPRRIEPEGAKGQPETLPMQVPGFSPAAA